MAKLNKRELLKKALEDVAKRNERIKKLKKEISESRQKKISNLKVINELVNEHWEIPDEDFQKILGETVNSLQEFIDKKSESADVTTKVKTEKIESEPVKPAVKVETVETNPVKVNQRQQTNVAQNLPAEVKPQNSVVAPVNVVANKISQPVNNSEEEEPNLDTEEGIARWFNGGK